MTNLHADSITMNILNGNFDDSAEALARSHNPAAITVRVLLRLVESGMSHDDATAKLLMVTRRHEFDVARLPCHHEWVELDARPTYRRAECVRCGKVDEVDTGD